MDGLLNDLRFGVRSLLKSPGFAVMVVVTLALGIGANASIFSVVNGLLLSALPYEDPEGVIQVWASNEARGWDQASVSAGDFYDWREQNTVFDEMTLYDNASFNLAAGGEPERVAGVLTTSNLFRLLGREPDQGRVFQLAEESEGATSVVVVSHGLWRRRFAEDRDFIGKDIILDGVARTVIGIMPADFMFPRETTDVWVPSDFAEAREERGSHSFAAVARLAEGATLEQARVEMNLIAERLEKDYPDSNTGWRVSLITFWEELFDRETLVVFNILMLAVGFVLLIACANVANLLLARGLTREKEVSIRVALGAHRRQLFRQLMSENLIIALIGGAFGVLVTYVGMNALLAVAPADAPRLEHVRLDSNVLLYTLGITLVTAFVFGLVPALRASRPDIHRGLKESGQRSSGGTRHRLLRGLVACEVALALVLLVLGLLMIRSFQQMQKVDPGFDTDNVLTLRISLPEAAYPEDSQRSSFYREALTRVRALPGVAKAGAVHSLPLGNSNSWRGITIEGQPVDDPSQRYTVGFLAVTDGYQEALGVAVMQGRGFRAEDLVGDERPLLINQKMAARYWPESSALGQRLKFGDPDDDEPWFTIVGVVADIRHSGLDDPPRPELYMPYQEASYTGMALVIRTSGEPGALVPSVREAIWSVDPALPLYSIRTMDQLIAEDTDGPRIMAQILGVLAIGALVLASVGVYGVISFAVSQRQFEIGIRQTMGAQQRDVFALVIQHGLGPVLIGVVAGLVVALGVTRMTTSLLFGVSPTDPVTYVTITVILLLVALMASVAPARRATRMDPLAVLRAE